MKNYNWGKILKPSFWKILLAILLLSVNFGYFGPPRETPAYAYDIVGSYIVVSILIEFSKLVRSGSPARAQS